MNILIALAGETKVNIKDIIKNKQIDYIVAVDGGADLLIQNKVQSDIIIGDFDSITTTNNINSSNTKIIKLSPQKDETDFEWALNYINKNYQDTQIYVVGFMSFMRIEHLYANLKLIKPNINFLEENTVIKMLLPGKHLTTFPGYISFFALEAVKDLTLINFKYPLNKYELSTKSILCISNELAKESGTIEFSKGKLLMFTSQK
ncbi:MAG: thiamine diphosphokinase [Mycoplasmatales bacterium]